MNPEPLHPISGCALCGNLEGGLTAPGLVSICSDCLDRDGNRQLLDNATGCFEEYRLGFVTAVGQFFYGWVVGAGTISAMCTGLVQLIWIPAAVAGQIGPLDPVRWFSVTAMFFGMGFALISVAALPLSLVSFASIGTRRLRFDPKRKAIVRQGLVELAIPLQDARRSTKRYFSSDGLLILLPGRERIVLSNDRVAIACGHSDEAFDRWTRLLRLLGVCPADPPAGFRHGLVKIAGGLVIGLTFGLLMGTLLAVITTDNFWLITAGFTGAIDGILIGIVRYGLSAGGEWFVEPFSSRWRNFLLGAMLGLIANCVQTWHWSGLIFAVLNGCLFSWGCYTLVLDAVTRSTVDQGRHE